MDLTLEKNMTVTKKKASESPKTKETKEVPDYFGHRQRLKARFVADMGKTMADYELLELILIYAIPRKDVKPLARHCCAAIPIWQAYWLLRWITFSKMKV